MDDFKRNSEEELDEEILCTIRKVSKRFFLYKWTQQTLGTKRVEGLYFEHKFIHILCL